MSYKVRLLLQCDGMRDDACLRQYDGGEADPYYAPTMHDRLRREAGAQGWIVIKIQRVNLGTTTYRDVALDFCTPCADRYARAVEAYLQRKE